MKRIITATALLLSSLLAFGQLDNSAFEDRRRVEESDSGKLFLGLQMLGFGKNNEYANTIIEGYTLFGYQFNPYLSYHLNQNIRIEAGFFLLKDFGTSDFTTTAPTLSIKYQKKDFSVTFGTLDGSLNHRLIEPMYDFERVITNRLESGLQAQWIKDGLFFDAWVDWNKMIYLNDPGQEQLTAGLNFNKRLFKFGATEFNLPVQLLATHKGGQINNHLGPIETLMNSAIGGELVNHSNGFIREIRLNGYYLFYKTVNGDLSQPFRNGSGAYFNATASTKVGLDVMLSYWRGHEFISVEGGKIYPSVSVFDYTHQQQRTNLMILRMLYTKKIAEGLIASARVEPFYDFSFNSFQYSYGFYLNFRERFFLWKRNGS